MSMSVYTMSVCNDIYANIISTQNFIKQSAYK